MGDFSRATHLSIKTLRHYHQVGLLQPATVNPDTGYRYYSAHQIPTAQVIRRLRDLEMPVADVKAVLAAPDAAARNATGPAGGVFASELLQQDRGQATVFIPVEGGVRAIGRVTSLVIPAAELAIISHHGSLADADLSYAKLGSYATTHEISIDGPLYEYYLRGAGETPDETEWRTEIGWPIFRADASRP